MDDSEVLQRIQALVDDEHALRERRAAGDLATGDHERLKQLEVNLDQCWDLLRQRRALRETGGDPDAAHVRPGTVVERYQQ